MMNTLTTESIENKVYMIRGKQVMLDYDLAEIYGYEVKALNQQVKRNINRFPEDFMFQLNFDEIPDCSKSQIVTLNKSGNYRGYNIKKLPYAFTEQGIYMLATVLKGELAENQSIFIIRAFREMRHYINENRQFVTHEEISLLSCKLSSFETETRAELNAIHDEINMLSENFISNNDLKEFVIYKDHKFEADLAYIDIYSQARKSIFVIDDYVDTKTLQLLSHKKKNVEVILFTQNRNKTLTDAEINDFNKQYSSLIIKNNPDSHDRFIVIDYGTKSEKIFHCGHSSKDAGNKICAIMEFSDKTLLHPLIEEYLK